MLPCRGQTGPLPLPALDVVQHRRVPVSRGQSSHLATRCRERDTSVLRTRHVPQQIRHQFIERTVGVDTCSLIQRLHQLRHVAHHVTAARHRHVSAPPRSPLDATIFLRSSGGDKHFSVAEGKPCSRTKG